VWANPATKIALLVVGTPTLAALVLYGCLFVRSMLRHWTLEHLIALLFLWQTQMGAAFAIAAALLGAGAILYQTETTQRLEEARRKQAKDAELETRATELQNLRQALHTEVAMTASQCLKTLNDFTRTDSTTKNPRSALMPRLVIYEQNTGKIGLLSRNEIVNLIRFSGELYDLSVVANDLIRRQMAGPIVTGDVLLLRRMLADACRYAADFMETVPGIPDADEDRPFIVRLREAAHGVNPGPT
jgi:hypothetical protein